MQRCRPSPSHVSICDGRELVREEISRPDIAGVVVQGHCTVRRRLIHVGAELHTQLDGLQRVGLRRSVLRRRTLRIPEPQTRCRHQWRHILDRGDLGVGAVLEQETHQGDVAALGGEPERRGTDVTEPRTAHADRGWKAGLPSDVIERDLLPRDPCVRIGAFVE